MTPARHALIKDIFLAATSCSREARTALLESRCGQDADLRGEVEKLLAHHDANLGESGTADVTASSEAWRRAQVQLDLDAEATAALPLASSRVHVTGNWEEFQSGFVFAERYRIISKLGSGGMGVVYRAYDLILEQHVALKFLTAPVASNRAWLNRFRNEVRLSREVTHQNVCRVFDIGEAEGRHFLSMEYVDGEDLASLLFRIGRFSANKAIDIARQICIGLAAAHGAGILHRDLKPANVMLDGRGQVRLTDFGLATLPDQLERGDVRSGTPAYMAPEQITGVEVTVRSDVYALGLLLYEVFSGRPAFEAKANSDYVELHQKHYPAPLEEIVDGLHPDVAAIIARCLEKDPNQRPASALEVAAALPGGNILSAAMAANLTPTPQMVAAASNDDSRKPAAKLLLAIALVLFASLAITRHLAKLPWEGSGYKPPEALAERAETFLGRVGFSTPPGHSAYGYCDIDEAVRVSGEFLGGDSQNGMLGTTNDSSLLFWYRQSTDLLQPSNINNVMFGTGRVTPSDPPLRAAGSVLVMLDQSGRLQLFHALPRAHNRQENEERAQLRGVWDEFHALAGLASLDLSDVTPTLLSTPIADETFSWRTSATDEVPGELHVNALARHGSPIYFAVSSANSNSLQNKRVGDLRRRKHLVATSFRLMLFAATLGAVPLAWRNNRKGRADRHGAWRLGVFTASVSLCASILQTTHTWQVDTELLLICIAAMRAVGTAALVTVFYLALEPYARRHWPHMLVTWSRVLSGNLKDQTVGEHTLIGVCLGCFWALAIATERALLEALGWSVRHSVITDRVADKLLSGRLAIAGYLESIPRAIVMGLLVLLMLAFFRSWLGRTRWAGVLAALLLLPITLPLGGHILTTWLFMGVGGACLGVWITARFGLVAIVTGIFVAKVLNTSPLTMDLSAWYAETTFYALIIVCAITYFGSWAARRRAVPA